MTDRIDCSIAALHLHPIKSCAGIAVDEALLIETGLEFDRAWMVVDAHGEMVTQRSMPRLARVRSTLRTDDVVLRAPGMLALHLSLGAVESPVRARVWNDEVKAFDMGTLAAQWFSDYLGQAARLVRFDPDQLRRCDPAWTGELQAQTAFADGFPLLVTSLASLDELNRRLVAGGEGPVTMERLRPNLVLDGLQAHDEDHVDELTFDGDAGGRIVLRLVKPCARCSIPDVDPATAQVGHAVRDALAGYRADARVGGALTFGMNAVVVEGVDLMLRVGQRGSARWSF